MNYVMASVSTVVSSNPTDEILFIHNSVGGDIDYITLFLVDTIQTTCQKLSIIYHSKFFFITRGGTLFIFGP